MAQAYTEIQTAGGELVVIAMSDVQTVQSTIESKGLTYPLLPDPDRSVIGTLYAYAPTDEKPPAATYVVDTEGIVVFERIETGTNVAPTTQELVDAVTQAQ